MRKLKNSASTTGKLSYFRVRALVDQEIIKLKTLKNSILLSNTGALGRVYLPSSMLQSSIKLCESADFFHCSSHIVF